MGIFSVISHIIFMSLVLNYAGNLSHYFLITAIADYYKHDYSTQFYYLLPFYAGHQICLTRLKAVCQQSSILSEISAFSVFLQMYFVAVVGQRAICLWQMSAKAHLQFLMDICIL